MLTTIKTGKLTVPGAILPGQWPENFLYAGTRDFRVVDKNKLMGFGDNHKAFRQRLMAFR